MVAIYKSNKERRRDLSDEDFGKLIGYIQLLQEIGTANKRRNSMEQRHEQSTARNAKGRGTGSTRPNGETKK